jgi:hypothetical protein
MGRMANFGINASTIGLIFSLLGLFSMPYFNSATVISEIKQFFSPTSAIFR